MKGKRIRAPRHAPVLAAVFAAAVIASACATGADEARSGDAPAGPAASVPNTTEAIRTEESNVNESNANEHDVVAAQDADAEPTGVTEVPIAPIATAATSPDTGDEAGPGSTEPSAEASATGSPQTNDDQPMLSCRRITDFDGAADDEDWVIVNDGVMGGRSNGMVAIRDSVMRFTGAIVTAGGGFTSVRYRLSGGEMTDSTSLRLRVRADQRVYGVTLEDNAEVGQRSVSHRADIDTSATPDADGWIDVALDYSELAPSVFGQSVEAPPFDPDSAREIGIIIADGIDGEFALEVDWIDICR